MQFLEKNVHICKINGMPEWSYLIPPSLLSIYPKATVCQWDGFVFVFGHHFYCYLFFLGHFLSWTRKESSFSLFFNRSSSSSSINETKAKQHLTNWTFPFPFCSHFPLSGCVFLSPKSSFSYTDPPFETISCKAISRHGSI